MKKFVVSNIETCSTVRQLALISVENVGWKVSNGSEVVKNDNNYDDDGNVESLLISLVNPTICDVSSKFLCFFPFMFIYSVSSLFISFSFFFLPFSSFWQYVNIFHITHFYRFLKIVLSWWPAFLPVFLNGVIPGVRIVGSRVALYLSGSEWLSSWRISDGLQRVNQQKWISADWKKREKCCPIQHLMARRVLVFKKWRGNSQVQ